MNWFSCNVRIVRIVCLIEGQGAWRYMDCVHLLRADDYEAAFTRALAIGPTHEQEYRNVDGKRVRWRFKKIVSLDQLPDDLVDGVEAYSEPTHLEPDEFIAFDATFRPEDSNPTNTI